MAFCTTCGANVQGAFCTACGTPAAASGSQAPPPQPVPQTPPAAQWASTPDATAPVKRGKGPLFWVLIIVLGLVATGVIAMVGVGAFFVHKARQAGLDPELMRRNPAYAAARMMIASNPDVEEVSHDEATGTITVRDKRTGKVSSMSFNDLKNGRFSFSAEDENGKRATLEMGAGAGKLPSWVPTYPGATASGTISVRGSGDGENGEGGSITFTTPDAVTKVLSYYQDKAKDLGMEATFTGANEGGMLVLTQPDEKRSLSVMLGGGGKTSIHIIYSEKK
jgi:hypothetical protein